MKKRVRRVVPLILSSAMVLTSAGQLIPLVQAEAEEVSVTPAVQWDFADGIDGWYYSADWAGSYTGEGTTVEYDQDMEALKAVVDYSNDVDASWSQIGICYWTDEGMDLTGVNNVTFDMIYDTADRSTGSFSVKAFSNAGIDQYVSTDTDAAETVEGTLVKNQVTIDFEALTAEKGAAANDFTIALVGVNTDYKGEIWFDNVSLNVVETSSIEEQETGSFDFESGIDGWSYGSGWEYQYNGATPSVEWSDGRMKIAGADFSQDGDKDWSNFAVTYWNEAGLNLKGSTQMTLDVWYETEKLTDGALKMGLYSGAGIDSSADITDLTAEEDTGLTKGKVTMTFDPVTSDAVQDLGLKVVGCNTTYQGDIYIDNIRFTALVDTSDTSVDSTIPVNEGNPVTSDGASLTFTAQDGSAQTVDVAGEVTLVDPEAAADAVAVYQYLQAAGKSDSVLYGHQNDTWHKAGSSSLSDSDTYDVTGMYPAVVGLDTLSLTGNEYSASRYNSEMSGTTGYEAVDTEGQSKAEANVEAAAKLTNYNIANGSIITLSAHMPNFSIVAENDSYDPEKDPSYAKYDFSGYTPNTLTGDVMNGILPGGQYNEIYTAYLDMIADYADQVDGTILFRPFHEATGSWFWWGAAFCDAETYQSVFKYTVEYLRDDKDIHNMIYVYGPGSEASTVEEYEVRYPGDEYVDMVGFDMYDSDPVDDQETVWFGNLKNQLALVQEFADAHGKLMAVTETGVASSSADPGHSQTALHETGNNNLNWYNMVLDAVSESDASFFLLWANFAKTSGYYSPYVDSVNADGSLHGHETLDGFISFFNDGRSVFAGDQLGVTDKITPPDVSPAAQGITGYITAPIAGTRVTEATELTARVTGAAGEELAFVLTGATEENVQTVPAVLEGNTASAQLTAETLAALGESADGKLELTADGTVIASIGLIYNIPEPEEDPYEIDGFENYYGADSMLTSKWTTNKDSGCTITLNLTDDESLVMDGEYALSFTYNETATGWAGATISKEVDWSDCDALQFYTIPDGNNQKVVIQIQANGTTYEAYLNLYEEYAANDGTQKMLVTIPFAEFVERDTAGNPAGGLADDRFAIQSFGLWVNAISDSEAIDENGMVSGTIIYDKITAVNSGAEQATFEVITDEPGTDDPGTDDPGTDDPGTDEPGTDDPGTDEPGTDDPGTDDPGTDDPGTDDPGTDTPNKPSWDFSGWIRNWVRFWVKTWFDFWTPSWR